jgi:arsenite methyltransferase
MELPSEEEALRESVREKYAQRARRVVEGSRGACCDPITSDLYANEETQLLPDDAVKASLGCGNPTALAQLKDGESVLDLGSGGGIDVLLSAKRVGPSGFAYGLDMTDEMLELARKNAAELGTTNVEFLEGQLEHVPLPDSQVDVIISNCVINLSSDKDRVLREAFRVLKPGGRFAVSDVVAQGRLPADIRHDLEAWVGCVAGALEEHEYRAKLAAAGFRDVDIEVTRVYDFRQLSQSARGEWDEAAAARYEASGGRLVSAFVRARKPTGGGARLKEA